MEMESSPVGRLTTLLCFFTQFELWRIMYDRENTMNTLGASTQRTLMLPRFCRDLRLHHFAPKYITKKFMWVSEAHAYATYLCHAAAILIRCIYTHWLCRQCAVQQAVMVARFNKPFGLFLTVSHVLCQTDASSFILLIVVVAVLHALCTLAPIGIHRCTKALNSGRNWVEARENTESLPYGLSAHLTFSFCSTAGFVCTVC